MTSEPTTFRAAITSVLSPSGLKTIAVPEGKAHTCPFPLTGAVITLHAGEVFMASTDLGEVQYLKDLTTALKWARSIAPDAVVILSPAAHRKGITGFDTLSLHERAIPVAS